MKSVLIIGMGRMGRHLARKMLQLGNDVMVVDIRPEIINSLSESFTDSAICDCTNEAVVASLGVDNFDICFVTIGEDFQASLVVTSLLKKHRARHIVAKTNQDIQADLLRAIGADEIVNPEVEIAEKLAVRHNARNIFDYVPLTEEFSIYEIPVLPAWIGRSLIELDIRRKYHVNIIAVKNGEELNANLSGEYAFRPEDHVILIGKSDEVFRLSAKS